MPIFALMSDDTQVVLHKIINRITKDDMALAMEIFDRYKKKGVITSEFSDKTWALSDEIRRIRLDFSVDEIFLQRNVKTCTPLEFIHILKMYFCFCLGRYSLELLKKILANIKLAMVETMGFCVMPKSLKVLSNAGVVDFMSILPDINDDLLINLDEEDVKIRRRSMAEYQSYFLFDKLLGEFWAGASDVEKELYYPIYLWWEISMILPSRVTEFTLMPKECIDGTPDAWKLKIRRTQLKGKKRRPHGYTIKEDYEIKEYAISNKIASAIQDYKERTKRYEEAEIDSLFSNDVLVKLLDMSNLKKRGYLDAYQMAMLLDWFYVSILQGKYGLRILDKGALNVPNENGELRRLHQHEIVRMTLGDSRHIAIQNMLINGCNILIAKELTGQESANMVFHYSGNIKNLIRCRAYTLFQMSKQKEVTVPNIVKKRNNILVVEANREYKEVDGGVCYSPLFVLYQDCKDCFMVAGECECCTYFKPTDKMAIIRRKQELLVEEKLSRLLAWLSSARANKNEEEMKVLANQLESDVENLQSTYMKLLERNEKI